MSIPDLVLHLYLLAQPVVLDLVCLTNLLEGHQHLLGLPTDLMSQSEMERHN